MAQVNPIPEGYGTITPAITVRGGKQAIEFYKKAFGAEERMCATWPDGKSIMHAELEIGSSIFMLSDENSSMNAYSPEHYKGTSSGFYLYVKDAESVQKKAIEAGAKEVMPVEEMFWGDKVGCVIDPFGHQWNIATHTRDLTPAQIRKGQEDFFARMDHQPAK
jgi:uncharacterized glyoxalase superfamily protein PhnB